MLAEAVSLSTLPILAYPWFRILTDMSMKVYLVWALGVVFAVFMSYIFKYTFSDRYMFSRRPVGAKDCSLINKGGPAGGRPGFPSGHTTTVAAFWALGYILTKNVWFMYLGVAHVVAMGWSRVQLECHTLEQVVAGAVCGAVSAWVWALAARTKM